MRNETKHIFFVRALCIFFGIFFVCDTSLVGAYYLQPPDARAIFDIIIYSAMARELGAHNVLGAAQTEKTQRFYSTLLNSRNYSVSLVYIKL